MIKVVNYPPSSILALFHRFPCSLFLLLNLRCFIVSIMFPSLTHGIFRNVLISILGPCRQVLPVHLKRAGSAVCSLLHTCAGAGCWMVLVVSYMNDLTFHLVPVVLSPYSVTERSMKMSNYRFPCFSFSSVNFCFTYFETWLLGTQSFSREGYGTPLQYSCLENLRDGGAWWAAVYGVTQSRTQLKWLSSSSSHLELLWFFYQLAP